MAFSAPTGSTCCLHPARHPQGVYDRGHAHPTGASLSSGPQHRSLEPGSPALETSQVSISAIQTSPDYEEPTSSVVSSMNTNWAA